MPREPGKHRKKPGKHAQDEQGRVYVVKYKTSDGDTRTDGAEFDNKADATEHAADVQGFPNVVSVWVE
jgi:hypothetical protein